jgi:hypothetical protein
MQEFDEKPIDVFAEDKSYFLALYNLFVPILIGTFIILYAVNTFSDDRLCITARGILYFWPQVFHMEKTIDLTSFTPHQKCTFSLDQGIFSFILLLFSIWAIALKFIQGNARLNGGLLFVSFLIGLVLFLASFSGFIEHGVYALNYKQSWLSNTAKSLFSILGFYICLFFFFYSLLALRGKPRME